MKKIYRKIRRAIINAKQYFGRVSSYISMATTIMVLFLTLSKLKEIGWISFELDKYFVPIIIISFIVLYIIGWFEVRVLKGYSDEVNMLFDLCPPWVEMRDMIRDLHEKEKKNGNI